jgi:hypothetical protein
MTDSAAQAYWQAEYEFYYKIISGEVERLRFNDGFEPVSIDLYATNAKNGPVFLGVTRIGRKRFRAIVHRSFDAAGKEILKLKLFPEP